MIAVIDVVTGGAMRLSLRLIISLILGITLVTTLFTFYAVEKDRVRRESELEKRAAVVGDSLLQAVQPVIVSGAQRDLTHIVQKFSNREYLAGIAIYDTKGSPIAVTPELASQFATAPDIVRQTITSSQARGGFIHVGDATLHLYALPLKDEDAKPLGGLIIVHDATFIAAQMKDAWRDTFVHAL